MYEYRFTSKKWFRIIYLTIILELMMFTRALHGTSSEPNLYEEDDTSASTSSTATKIPLVPKNPRTQSHPYQDPFAKGFEITARVFSDKHDSLAHFDDNRSEKKENRNEDANETSFSSTNSPTRPIVLPYWECGITGSNTAPIPINSLTIRHLLGHQSAGSFSSACGVDDTDSHPRLVVPLTSLEIVLNSGEKRIFSKGDVILLENCLTGGHKLQGFEGEDMIVMILTLSFPYHHVGRERDSLSSILNWKQNPCKVGLGLPGDDNIFDNTGSTDTNEKRIDSRRLGLGIFGAGLSLTLANFLGKVAPLKLAVFAGGGALTAGGTFTVIKVGEYGLDNLDLWHERRLLRRQDSTDDVSTHDRKRT